MANNNLPTKPGRPRRFNDRKELPTETSGYYIRRANPTAWDRTHSWLNETNPDRRYIGIGNPRERLAEHERAGRYDPNRDHIEVIPMKEDATYDELRDWERKKIALHRPVHNKSPGGEGRPPGHLRSFVVDGIDRYEDDDDDDEWDDDDGWVPCCASCKDVDDVSGSVDDDDDWYCSRCDEYIDEDGDVVDYDDDDDDDDDDPQYCYCGNFAARDCSSGSCGVCCSGCDRHGW